ncbi:hypothetical protein J6590_043413 [Homalodisca vitripennis]|nr:hypothetical protein J6590_043413 [Homalodisca vitripennis]
MTDTNFEDAHFDEQPPFDTETHLTTSLALMSAWTELARPRLRLFELLCDVTSRRAPIGPAILSRPIACRGDAAGSRTRRSRQSALASLASVHSFQFIRYVA